MGMCGSVAVSRVRGEERVLVRQVSCGECWGEGVSVKEGDRGVRHGISGRCPDLPGVAGGGDHHSLGSWSPQHSLPSRHPAAAAAVFAVMCE
ncbi:hypothetical protein E2C01_058239 [Portunus trituberculatus]|uniref:Uncharacterized protein n=1 Tax=Portunus trituberculatus TaxID=210409 RepID=A0A5B7H4R7_PORTR|nr:hypothetical protein [Portunus trituberculatus]